MNKSGPIVIIGDDVDDQKMLIEVFKELQWQNKYFTSTTEMKQYNYLEINSTQPFIILSYIKMTKLNGFELRDKIHNNEQLRLKCIPYIFFSTTSDQRVVIDAYSQSVQGFFVKPPTYDEVRRIIHNIVEYWNDCRSPNIT